MRRIILGSFFVVSVELASSTELADSALLDERSSVRVVG